MKSNKKTLFQVKKSIKRKLFLTVFIPVISLMLIAFIALYQYIQSNAYENAKVVSENQALLSSYEISQTIDTYTNQVDYLQQVLNAAILMPVSDRESYIEREMKSIFDSNASIVATWTHWNNDEIKPGNVYTMAFIKADGKVVKSPFDSDQFMSSLDALSSNMPHVFEPYLVNESMRFTYAKPIQNSNGNAIATVGIEFDLNVLQSYIEEQQIFNDGFMRILSNSGIVVAHKSFARVGKYSGELDEQGQGIYKDIIQSGSTYTSIEYSEAIKQDTYKSLAPLRVGNTLWSVGTILTEDEILAESNKQLLLITVIALLFILFIGILILWVSSSISYPLKRVTGIAHNLTELDLSQNVEPDLLMKSDEVGILARAFDDVIRSFRTFMAINSKISNELKQYAVDLNNVSQESSQSADEISKTIEQVAFGADEQARDAEQAVQAIDYFGKLIETEQEELKELNRVNKEVTRLKNEGLINISQLVEKTKISQESSNEIAFVIKSANESASKIAVASQMIKNIADQTNLLALNAAIEAARAGEAGRGFSVVADEIRKLAEQSEQFTGEINNIINDLTNRTERAVDTVNVMSQVITEQTESVNETKIKFEGISEAIERTDTVIDKLNESGKIMSDKKSQLISNIQNLAAVTEEYAASTEEVNASVEEQTVTINTIAEASDSLSQIANELNESISKFKM